MIRGLRLAGSLAVAVAGLWLASCGGLPSGDPLEECAQPLAVVADDGARLEVLEHRCRASDARRPGLVVWPPGSDGRGAWRRQLAHWGTGGRTLWLVVTPVRDGVEVADVSALVEALAGRPGVDPGRVGVVVSGIAAQALAHRIERLDPAPSAVALVTGETLPSLAPPEGMEVRSFAAEDPPAAAREASRWLRGQLAVD